MADVLLTLLVLKTRQVEQLRRFYQTLGLEFAEEQLGKGPVWNVPFSLSKQWSC